MKGPREKLLYTVALYTGTGIQKPDYLATIDADPADPRTDDLTGDSLGPEWGLHHLDSNIALDDLVAVVGAQAESYGR